MAEPITTPCPICAGPLHRDATDLLYATCRDCGHDVMVVNRAEYAEMAKHDPTIRGL